MKIYLRHKDQKYTATAAGDVAVVSGLTCCGATLRVFAKHSHRVNDRAYHGEAIAKCCGAIVGTLVVEPNTIFGLDEDRRVLNGRCRVY